MQKKHEATLRRLSQSTEICSSWQSTVLSGNKPASGYNLQRWLNETILNSIAILLVSHLSDLISDSASDIISDTTREQSESRSRIPETVESRVETRIKSRFKIALFRRSKGQRTLSLGFHVMASRSRCASGNRPRGGGYGLKATLRQSMTMTFTPPSRTGWFLIMKDVLIAMLVVTTD